MKKYEKNYTEIACDLLLRAGFEAQIYKNNVSIISYDEQNIQYTKEVFSFFEGTQEETLKDILKYCDKKEITDITLRVATLRAPNGALFEIRNYETLTLKVIENVTPFSDGTSMSVWYDKTHDSLGSYKLDNCPKVLSHRRGYELCEIGRKTYRPRGMALDYWDVVYNYVKKHVDEVVFYTTSNR